MNKLKLETRKFPTIKSFQMVLVTKKKNPQMKTRLKQNKPALRTQRFSNVQMNQTQCITAVVHEVG